MRTVLVSSWSSPRPVRAWMVMQRRVFLMARKPDTPCIDCGKLLWSGTGSKPAGERRCRACRAAVPEVVALDGALRGVVDAPVDAASVREPDWAKDEPHWHDVGGGW